LDIYYEPWFGGRMWAAELVAAGLTVGVGFGVFGAGGSAFATPLLVLVGVPGVAAVASPLPAMLPASITGARRHVRAGNLDRRLAWLAVAGGVPGVVVGAVLSAWVRAEALVLLSGLLLLVVGVRVLLPDPSGHGERADARRRHTGVVVGATFAVGLLTGLLANGGGFLLVPLFIVGLGLTATRAAGTSMVVVAVMIVPTLVAHWTLGHIDWTVSLAFAAGAIPGSLLGSSIAARLHPRHARLAFGVVLVTFASWFLLSRI
jgi:uncharacterized membrane protein YfcA